MRIIQLLPELKVGGVERGTVDLSDHLVKLGHDSAVISAGGQLVDLLNEHGAKHYELPIAKKNIRALAQIGNLKKIYSEYQPDIVHVRSRFPAWINYFALKNFRGKRPLSYLHFMVCIANLFTANPCLMQMKLSLFLKPFKTISMKTIK